MKEPQNMITQHIEKRKMAEEEDKQKAEEQKAKVKQKQEENKQKLKNIADTAQKVITTGSSVVGAIPNFAALAFGAILPKLLKEGWGKLNGQSK